MNIYSDLLTKKELRNILKTQNELLFQGDVLAFLKNLSSDPIFDLVVTSPPYNIGKSYESVQHLDDYFASQQKVIHAIDKQIKPSGAICWQVGNYIDKSNQSIYPLDFGFHEIFSNLGYILKNRIIWKFGHGMHARKRLSGRYETVLWYVKSNDYTFNLDAIRVPSKYPKKRYYKGPKKGEISSNPLGKNPEDVWEIPNVKGNHIEKTSHPCQFPIGLVERIILGMTNEGDVVFDPYMGVGSAGLAALLHKRKFVGTEIDVGYVNEALKRFKDFYNGSLKYRSHLKPIYDHKKSPLGDPNV